MRKLVWSRSPQGRSASKLRRCRRLRAQMVSEPNRSPRDPKRNQRALGKMLRISGLQGRSCVMIVTLYDEHAGPKSDSCETRDEISRGAVTTFGVRT